jgi:hypothetical protein
MATTDPQRRQILPSRRCTLPVAAEDGPWIVTVAENPHDPSSYTLYVRSAYLLALEIFVPLSRRPGVDESSYFDLNISFFFLSVMFICLI